MTLQKTAGTPTGQYGDRLDVHLADVVHEVVLHPCKASRLRWFLCSRWFLCASLKQHWYPDLEDLHKPEVVLLDSVFVSQFVVD